MINQFTFIDLFAGIGGMRLGFEGANARCVWSNDNDKFCATTYRENFKDSNFILKDIREIDPLTVPDFDILCAGFPCQAFSIAGVSSRIKLSRPHGFEDKTQGTLFFEIIRIINTKRPKVVFLENVPHLVRHDNGKTFTIIREAIEELGYSFYYKIVNAGAVVPQRRKRVFMIGFQDKTLNFVFPELPQLNPKLKSILEENVSDKYTHTDHAWELILQHTEKHRLKGHGFGHKVVDPEEQSGTLTARYYKDGSEILIPQNGKNPRRLTPRECARLQGFPDGFKIPVSDGQAWKQFGNAVTVPVVKVLAEAVIHTLHE